MDLCISTKTGKYKIYQLLVMYCISLYVDMMKGEVCCLCCSNFKRWFLKVLWWYSSEDGQIIFKYYFRGEEERTLWHISTSLASLKMAAVIWRYLSECSQFPVLVSNHVDTALDPWHPNKNRQMTIRNLPNLSFVRCEGPGRSSVVVLCQAPSLPN